MVQIHPCERVIFSGKDVPGHARRHSAMSCAKLAEQIEMVFGFWTRLGRMKRPPCGLMLNYFDQLLWPPCVADADIIFCAVVSLFLSFVSSPNLSGRRLDVYNSSTHDVVLVRILECMSEMCCTQLAENTRRKKSPFWHHRTTLSGCIFATKACIDNRKKTC